jgi:lysozyme
MRMTEEGLALIRSFEGFRGEAYRDAVGVWTIGFGHTSMAGPPEVTPGLRISREEANAVLARDVEKFASGVREAVKVPINDAQFSALVSFAYNVGLGALRGSSVLKAVNAGDFAEVPRRLSLWVKAGGRTLPGLVKRRAAEGALFAGGVSTPVAPPPPPTQMPAHNMTLWDAIAAALAALLEYFRKTKKEGM